MTNTKHTHTPGPWFASEGETNGIYEACIHNGVTIANITDEAIGCKANASLIAAAPDLLEALILLEERSSTLPAHSEFMTKARNKARAAIAKAMGAV
jgi:hypothetical protein